MSDRVLYAWGTACVVFAIVTWSFVVKNVLA